MTQNPPACVDWWRITVDLQNRGLTLKRISQEALIPWSTIQGYRNLGAEPRHRDGEALLAVWRRYCGEEDDIPMIACPLRQRALGRV